VVKVGDVIDIYGGNHSYYLDPRLQVCIDGQQKTLTLDAHAVQANANMQITGYDNTGTTTLGTPTNTSTGDYVLPIGAGATDIIYIKFKNNGANGAFDLCAIGVGVLNTSSISSVKLKEPGWNEVVVRKYLKTTVTMSGLGGSAPTISKYDSVWFTPSAERLHEWDSVKYQWEIKTASGQDPVEITPSANGAETGASKIAFVHLDCAYAKGIDGRMYYDYYQHDDSEGNVGLSIAGLAENITQPTGKLTAMLLVLK
jgi:hypothetical protein